MASKKKPLPRKAMKRIKGGAGEMEAQRSRVISLTVTFDAQTTS